MDAEYRQNITLLLQVARLYYEEGKTQQEISEHVGYSRATISRLLTQARERGVVQIRISHPIERLLSLEDTLRDRLKIEHVQVAPDDDAGGFNLVGQAAADLLVQLTHDGQVVAVGNGRTVAAAAQLVPPVHRASSTVVQMLGSIPGGLPAWGRDAQTVCSAVAHRFGATSVRMAVPLMVDNPELLRPLMREGNVAAALALAARADVALVGVAGVNASGDGNILAAYLTADVTEAIQAGGGVGHILDHYYDNSGRLVPTPLTPRTLSLSLDELRRIPLVIAAASGPEKVDAIIAAVRGGLVDALATDASTAQLISRRLAPITNGDV